MSEDSMLKCLIAFILGWIVCRMMGNGFSVGGAELPPWWTSKEAHANSIPCYKGSDGSPQSCMLKLSENGNYHFNDEIASCEEDQQVLCQRECAINLPIIGQQICDYKKCNAPYCTFSYK